MAYTQSQLEALEKAIASGVLRVTYDGNTTEYRSMADLKDAYNEVKKSLLGSAGTKIVRQVRITTQKGL